MLLQFEETAFWSYKNSCEKYILKFSGITHLFKKKNKTTQGEKKMSIIKDWIRKIKNTMSSFLGININTLDHVFILSL